MPESRAHSSLIADARYRPDDCTLELHFASGKRYLYSGVSPEIAADFAAAPSKGQFFNSAIKGRFTCHELARQKRERYASLSA